MHYQRVPFFPPESGFEWNIIILEVRTYAQKHCTVLYLSEAIKLYS
jgi:hypothetical protein